MFKVVSVVDRVIDNLLRGPFTRLNVLVGRDVDVHVEDVAVVEKSCVVVGVVGVDDDLRAAVVVVGVVYVVGVVVD